MENLTAAELYLTFSMLGNIPNVDNVEQDQPAHPQSDLKTELSATGKIVLY